MKLSVSNSIVNDGISENEIFSGCLKGNVKYQKILFDRYSGKFMTVCLRYSSDQMQAEDMLQEAFIRIFNHLNQFKSEGSFEGWMRRVVVNVCLKAIKNKRINFSTDEDAGIQIPDKSTDAQ